MFECYEFHLTCFQTPHGCATLAYFLRCVQFQFLLQNAWVDGKQNEAPTTSYKNGDGFELYIDAARFLPDNCAFVKVILNKICLL